ncbi:MAG: twin-arginine translocase TatA/TatE family subunit [Gemmatimonadota bacterium]
MFGLGFGELLLIAGLVILIFGARRIPRIARGLGEGIRYFKGEIKPPEDGSEGDDSSP